MRFLLSMVMGLVLLAPSVSHGQRESAARVTVAILYFDYDGKDEELGFLRKGLAEMLVSDLSDVPGIELVERANLEAVLSELKLNQSKKIDRGSANKVGRLLGARYLVVGHYFHLYGTLQVSAKLINVERGTTKGFGSRRKVADFIDLEQELAEKLRVGLVALNKTKSKAPVDNPSPGRRVKRPKRLRARTAAKYGRALDAMDRGDKRDAKKLLAEVVGEQPDFALATRDLVSLAR